MPSALRLFRCGTIAYDAAWQWQRDTAVAVRSGEPDALALLQHEPVYTFGRNIRRDHLLTSVEKLRSSGAELVESDRGGDITFHGPGQLVAYPILDLRRRQLGPSDYVRALEETLIRALDRFGITANRVAGRPGVWVDCEKIGAIGVRVQGGVTMHGFALNVAPDLSWYDAIVPCGISDASVTSMERLGCLPVFSAVEDAVADAFADVFNSVLMPVYEHPFAEPILTHGR